jgi:hypothetical protein
MVTAPKLGLCSLAGVVCLHCVHSKSGSIEKHSVVSGVDDSIAGLSGLDYSIAGVELCLVQVHDVLCTCNTRLRTRSMRSGSVVSGRTLPLVSRPPGNIATRLYAITWPLAGLSGRGSVRLLAADLL